MPILSWLGTDRPTWNWSVPWPDIAPSSLATCVERRWPKPTPPPISSPSPPPPKHSARRCWKRWQVAFRRWPSTRKGVRALVRHHETGLLVPERTISAFTQSLRTLLSQPELQASIRIRARSAAEQRTWESVLNDLLHTYEQVSEHRQHQCAA